MTKAPDILRIAIAQLNPTMGDIKGNIAQAREARGDATRSQADLVFFTELFVSGYPPEDLLRKPAFLKDCMEAVEELAEILVHRLWVSLVCPGDFRPGRGGAEGVQVAQRGGSPQ